MTKMIGRTINKVETVNDLKKIVDRLVENGKGDLPVLSMAETANLYVTVNLAHIISGQSPYEGLDLQDDFINSPDGEHVLLVLGDV